MKIAKKHFKTTKETIKKFFHPIECIVELHDYDTYIGYAVVMGDKTHKSPTKLRDIHLLNPSKLNDELERHAKAINFHKD